MEVTVTQNITTVVAVGSDKYLIKQTEDGRGVSLEIGDEQFFIPANAVAEVSAAILNSSVPDQPKARRGRPRKE